MPASKLLRFCCCPQRGGDQGSLLLTAALPARFSSVTYWAAYRPSDGVGLHRSWSRTIFSRRLQAAPAWLVADNRMPGHVRIIRTIPDASAKGGAWRSTPADTAVSRSLPAWPLRDGAFSGTPGGAALAAYPREVARCEQEVLYGCGPAQVGFGATCSPPSFTSPFILG